MTDPARKLRDLEPRKDFLICVDSDGCVFDSMEIKHKECFCPQFINHFDLQPVAKYGRQAWEFVNLYSRTRGVNRFLALVRALNLLAERKEVKTRGVTPPMIQGVRDWIQRETKLGNPALEAAVEQTANDDLRRALAWSMEVNETVRKIVRGVGPFPLVRECLERMQSRVDTIVVSQTPCEALVREWKEHGIDGAARLIAGQEMGTKTEHIGFAAALRYEPSKVLMIGDAPGDHEAARANQALFYPIEPGHEEESWQRFHHEALDRFLGGTYAGSYEDRLIGEFYACLPEKPPWEE